MQSPHPVPPKPKRGPKLSLHPSLRPLISKYPALIPFMSVLPFVSSLRPGIPDAPGATVPPGGAPSPSPSPTWRTRGRSLARRTVVPVAILAIAGVAFMIGRGGLGRQGAPVRVTGTATLKLADDGAHVRWQRDAIDVVVDKSFTDLAGPTVFGAAVDAWRASGALLPSVSTTPGESKQVGYTPNGPNENVVVYAPYGWAKAHNALAVTVVTYDNTTGTIVDADLLVNGGGRFFSNFPKDESDETDADTSIESAAGLDTSSIIKGQKTPRFDIQAVITHELGHFFGLGEDYDDSKTTMYTSTRAGEIHKRLLTKSDSDVITTLYAENPPPDGAPAPAKAGCGGAHLARGTDRANASWMGLLVATLGLGLLAASRRQQADRRVRVALRRTAKSTGRIARFGGFLTVVGLLVSLAPPDVRAAAGDAPVAVAGDAEVQVVGSAARWVEGMLETDLTVHVTTCHVANCPAADQHIVVAGGKLGNLTQVVGPFAVPEVGVLRSIGLRDGSGLLQRLRPTFKP